MLRSPLTSFDMMMLLPGFSMALHETRDDVSNIIASQVWQFMVIESSPNVLDEPILSHDLEVQKLL